MRNRGILGRWRLLRDCGERTGRADTRRGSAMAVIAITFGGTASALLGLLHLRPKIEPQKPVAACPEESL